MPKSPKRSPGGGRAPSAALARNTRHALHLLHLAAEPTVGFQLTNSGKALLSSIARRAEHADKRYTRSELAQQVREDGVMLRSYADGARKALERRDLECQTRQRAWRKAKASLPRRR